MLPYLIAVVHQDEEEIEAAHDGCRQVDVLLQALAAVVAPVDGVGCSQDGRASIQCGLEREEAEAKSGYTTADLFLKLKTFFKPFMGIILT